GRDGSGSGGGSGCEVTSATISSAIPYSSGSAPGRRSSGVLLRRELPDLLSQFCLIHLRPAPFTSVRPGRVRAGLTTGGEGPPPASSATLGQHGGETPGQCPIPPLPGPAPGPLPGVNHDQAFRKKRAVTARPWQRPCPRRRPRPARREMFAGPCA